MTTGAPSGLSHWFPIAQRVLPEWRYPKTKIVSCDIELVQLLDGQEPPGFQGLIADLELAALRVGGYPCFLRPDLCSAKHDWRDTCFVAEAGRLRAFTRQTAAQGQAPFAMSTPAAAKCATSFHALQVVAGSHTSV